MFNVKGIGIGGFGLLEAVITIIIIGLAMSAVTESFIVGSAKSSNIVNEEIAANVAKQTMAELNYCRNGGSVSGVCTANNISSLVFYTSPQGPTNVNNECFYTTIKAQNVDFSDTGGIIVNGNGSSKDYIQTIVQTGWFALIDGECRTPSAGTSYPLVTLSNIYANY
ncbi:hypothetical protein ACMCNP_07855 [Candidatus Acidulodesulfobacterium sp. H_13]|uniref:hypothetical protein n=1 Tax=Candidatus Acidulodesulfobacterium sp. H_13 TaxID=3395470 RepID=UPI003AF4BD61